MFRLNLLTLIFSCLAINCFAATPQLRQSLGSGNVDLLNNAEYVTILAIIPNSNSYEPLPEIHLAHDEIERLKRQLLDDHNYSFEENKNCAFVSELSFKFQDAEGKTIHLFVSPSCNQLLFSSGKKSILLDYEPARERLENYFQQLAKEIRAKNKGKFQV